MSDPNDPSARPGPWGSAADVAEPPASSGTHSGEAVDSAPAPEHRVTFEGRNADLWPLAVNIALLNLVTLFFYRFWGRTRVRQYLWSRSSLLGDRFAYTGTGKEMFIGFLIVLGLIILPVAAVSIYVFTQWGEDQALQEGYAYLLGIVSYFLFYVASYRALRYRLSRTNWRGIRGTQTGSSFLYGLKAFGWLLLTGLCMGLTYPLQRASLVGMKFNNAWFGDRKFSFSYSGRISELYRPFLRAWAGYIFKPILIMIPATALFGALIPLSARTGQAVNQDMLAVAMVAIWVLIGLGWMRTYARYKAREAGIMAPWTRFGNLTFRFETDHNKMFRLIFGNMLLTFLTLGFARPIAQKRSFRFIADHLRVVGEPDLETLGQSTDKGPGMGEGLADAFDAGSI